MDQATENGQSPEASYARYADKSVGVADTSVCATYRNQRWYVPQICAELKVLQNYLLPKSH